MASLTEVMNANNEILNHHFEAIANILQLAGMGDPIDHLSVASENIPVLWQMTWRR